MSDSQNPESEHGFQPPAQEQEIDSEIPDPTGTPTESELLHLVLDKTAERARHDQAVASGTMAKLLGVARRYRGQPLAAEPIVEALVEPLLRDSFAGLTCSDDFWRSLALGGKLAIGLIVLILVGVVVGFRALFTGFHLIFFEGDTWIFLFSDTLIRLFPMRFWQDSFIYVGLLTLVGAFILIDLTQKYAKSNLFKIPDLYYNVNAGFLPL